MTEKCISDSGMVFGPYQDEHCFHIEKCGTYLRLRERVKIAEFLLLHPTKDSPSCIWVVEAKSSAPHPNNQIHFDEFIEEIRDKMVSTFYLSLAIF